MKSIKGEVHLDNLASVIRDSKKDIACELDLMVRENWISKEVVGNIYVYKIKRVLDKPLRKLPKNKFAKFEISSAAVKRPSKYMNPFFNLMPLLNQDMRGTCVGFTGAYVAWFNQLRLVNPTPLTQAEVDAIKRNEHINVFNQCNMVCDILPKYAPSAEGLYDESRRIGNVNVPEGSYIDCAAQAYKTYGYNYEKDRMTAHTSFCAPMYYPLINNSTDDTKAFISKQASSHRADNYVEITTWDGLKNAIFTYGAVLIATNIFENYASQGSNGLLPEPNGEVIGGHAMCACGYDDELNVIYVIMSWGPAWSKLSGCTENYYRRAEGQAFAVLVSQDSVEGTPVPPTPDPTGFKLVSITSNKTCTMLVGTDKYLMNKAPALLKVMLEVGKAYVISCEVFTSFKIKEPKQVRTYVVPESDPAVVAFQFQEMSTSEMIANMIREILRKLRIIQK